MTTNQKITAETYLHGTVNGYPPAQWRLGGKVNGIWRLEHVKRPSQTTAYPDQFVNWDVVERLAGR